ncbi:hypothetical protein [Sphingomonas sp. KR3-1]|uniref:hypothetical protein n=1 Tax=Sphingomonas sp. KR3-1 TaxID=3156611 RepID=UPI0032B5A96E
MATALQKGVLICAGVAVLGGGLAGMSLGTYAQSGAFDFYKQTPPPGRGGAAATADSAGYYPLSRAAAPPPIYPENPSPPRALTIARPAEPADYQRAARIEDAAPAPVEDAALPEDDTPVIAPQHGSWSAPAPSEPAPAQAVAGDVAS